MSEVVTDPSEVFLREWDRCSRDFWYFSSTYLWIIDKNSRHVLLVPNREQTELILALEKCGTVYNLKARKLGMSTIVAAYFFWKCMFYPGIQAGTMTHDEESSLKLFKKIKLFYERLPDAFKVGPYALRSETRAGMEWVSGSEYRVASCLSGKFRSSDLHYIHFSEFAFYPQPRETAEAVIGAAVPGALRVYETTAKGLGYAHDAWYRGQGWGKVFFPWTRDPLASLSSPPRALDEMGDAQRAKLERYAKEHKLSPGRMWWVAYQLGEYNGEWRSFHQEHPATPELAFAVSTGRVFRAVYRDTSEAEGRLTFEEARNGRRYAMGVDVAAGGEKGDFSAVCVLDITDEAPRIVCTWYARESIPVFKAYVVELAKEYDALAVIESNNAGIALIQAIEVDHPDVNLWREQTWSRVGSKLTSRLGFNTGVRTRQLLQGAMIKWLGDSDRDPVIDVPCPRMRHEMNTFVWSETKTDRAEHQPGYHDDMLFAFGLACQSLATEGRAQVREARNKRPRTLREHRMFEREHGRPWMAAIDAPDEGGDPEEAAYVTWLYDNARIESAVAVRSVSAELMAGR